MFIIKSIYFYFKKENTAAVNAPVRVSPSTPAGVRVRRGSQSRSAESKAAHPFHGPELALQGRYLSSLWSEYVFEHETVLASRNSFLVSQRDAGFASRVFS